MRQPDPTQTINTKFTRVFELGFVFAVCVAAVVTFVFAILGAGIVAPVIGLMVALLWTGLAWLKGGDLVIRLSGAVEADKTGHARFYNVVDGVCPALGLGAPQLFVVDDDGLNALSTGRDQRHAALVVTQGLLDEATLVELEALIALQLYRIKSGATAVETFVVPTFGAAGVLSALAERVDFLRRIAGTPMPWIVRVFRRVHLPIEELSTDVAAVGFTRYPPGLAAGLAKMSGHSALVSVAPVTAHLWAGPPLAPNSAPALNRLHSPLGDRIAVLQEL